MLIRLCLLLILVGFPFDASATDYNIQLGVRSVDNNVRVTIQNNSSINLSVKNLQILLKANPYVYSDKIIIPPHQKHDYYFTVLLPDIPGSYPLIVTLTYLNEDNLISLRHVGFFNVEKPSVLDADCGVENAVISGEGTLVITSSRPAVWNVILPEEIQISRTELDKNKKIYHVKSSLEGFNNVYPYFAVAEEERDGIHSTGICQGSISLRSNVTRGGMKGKIPEKYLLVLSGAFFVACVVTLRSIKKMGHRLVTALNKYAARMLLVSLSYYVIKVADEWLGHSVSYVSWEKYRYFSDIVINNFRGSNYSYFFQYFIDFYYISCLFLVLPHLYYYDSRRLLEDDKYSSLMMSLLSIGDVFRGKRLYWTTTSKLGLLTICVKLFFTPFLVSWAINNTFHQIYLTKSFHWDLPAINAYLVALFIFIDTSVFSFGYLFEFDLLKNKIKSVEPTLLGWIVCLWCYPPFNVFSFWIFDYKLFNIAIHTSLWFQAAMTCLITLLWGIFVWASLALGFKASNLTNRGIVKAGPYRFVRHPAYTAKIMIWFIQGIFFSQYHIGLLLGFTFIYGLRAWTEERHLSKDPEYLEYKKMVQWKYIPRII